MQPTVRLSDWTKPRQSNWRNRGNNPGESDPNTDLTPQLVGDIVFQNVQFAFQPHQPVLRGINLDVRSGKIVALAGSTGGGKTTLQNLLTRFYDPTAGMILIDGHPLDTIAKRHLRRSQS